jgi:predicted O-methyltransferase YrrM
MSEGVWTAVDDYFAGQLVAEDAALSGARADAAAAGLPDIDITPVQGAFLQLLARIQGARTILELGTLAGYSTIWLARALPAGGRLTTLELQPDYARVARSNLDRAGVGDLVDLRVGPAADSLAALAGEGAGPFDFIFIDADKPGNPVYLRWALRLARPGTVILLDNAVRRGAVADPDTDDAGAIGVRQFTELAAAEPRLAATAIQTVGAKGHDGFILARVGD